VPALLFRLPPWGWGRGADLVLGERVRASQRPGGVGEEEGGQAGAWVHARGGAGTQGAQRKSVKLVA